MLTKIIIIAVVVIVVILVASVIKISSTATTPKAIHIDIATMEMCVSFFKRADIMNQLQSDKNLLAVAIKDDNKNNLVFTLFNKQTEKIMTPYCIYQYKTMDTDLQNAFADKDMIVLQ